MKNVTVSEQLSKSQRLAIWGGFGALGGWFILSHLPFWLQWGLEAGTAYLAFKYRRAVWKGVKAAVAYALTRGLPDARQFVHNQVYGEPLGKHEALEELEE